MRQYAEEILVVAVLLAAAGGWYVGWVVPNDKMLAAVSECVHERGSHVGDRTTWNKCYAEVENPR